MPNQNDLKFFLTSSERELLPSPSQSIGGYCSSVEYGVTARLLEHIDNSANIAIASGQISTSDIVSIGSEIMEILNSADTDGSQGNSVQLSMKRGAYGTAAKFHSANDRITAVKHNDFFNGSISESGKQYRCLAVRNTSQSEAFYNIEFYIKESSKNSHSIFRIGIETAKDQIISGTASGGNSISLVDSSLPDYADNYFIERALIIRNVESPNYNVSRIIASFDRRTKTFTFRHAFPHAITSGTAYLIEEHASQRIASGRERPMLGVLANSHMSAFVAANGAENAVGINSNGLRPSGPHLFPHETVYLWFERDISSNVKKYENNRIVFTAKYRNTQ